MGYWRSWFCAASTADSVAAVAQRSPRSPQHVDGQVVLAGLGDRTRAEEQAIVAHRRVLPLHAVVAELLGPLPGVPEHVVEAVAAARGGIGRVRGGAQVRLDLCLLELGFAALDVGTED